MERITMNKILENHLNLENKKNLLENHINFLSKHRGINECLEYGKFIHSDNPDFNIFFPFSNESLEKMNKEYTIYLPQWIFINEQMKLKYKKVASLTYMVLANEKARWEINKKIIIKRANSLSDIEDFSVTQAWGFCETEEKFNQAYSWMRQKNIENLDDNTQNFYVAYDNEKPVGVTLCIYYKNIAGIYAVATLPEYRKKGVSTTLIQRVVDDANNNNIAAITLQTYTESYAHSFYKKLGFEDVFDCGILKPIN